MEQSEYRKNSVFLKNNQSRKIQSIHFDFISQKTNFKVDCQKNSRRVDIIVNK